MSLKCLILFGCSIAEYWPWVKSNPTRLKIAACAAFTDLLRKVKADRAAKSKAKNDKANAKNDKTKSKKNLDKAEITYKKEDKRTYLEFSPPVY